MESAALGIPAIASNVKGDREAVTSGVTGLLVQRGDVRGVAEAMTTLLQDEPLRTRMSKDGIRRARSEFDQEDVFRRVATAYTQATASTPALWHASGEASESAGADAS